MTFISTKYSQFTYFAKQLRQFDWAGKEVLDFGGNIGNIMLDPNSTIEEERYTCIDVDEEAIEQGRATFPNAKWIFYNRHSYFFNPKGIRNLKIPKLDQSFDIIVAYSVFPNTRQSDMLDLVEQLRELLKEGGKLAFSFCDPNIIFEKNGFKGSNLQWRLEKDNQQGDIKSMLKTAETAKWCTLVNDSKLYIENEEIILSPEEQQKSYYTYYTVEYMQNLYPSAAIQAPVNNEMQHCCIIKAP